MEQEEPPATEELQASADRFRQILRDRGIESLSCPACGQSEGFGGFEDLALGIISDRKRIDPGPAMHGSIHAFNLTCSRCGFVSMFDYHVLDGEQ